MLFSLLKLFFNSFSNGRSNQGQILLLALPEFEVTEKNNNNNNYLYINANIFNIKTKEKKTVNNLATLN